MPQWIHDAASVIQIVLFAAAVLAYMFREPIIDRFVQRLDKGRPLPDAPPLTATQIKSTVLDSFGPEFQVDDLQRQILTEMGKTACLRRKEDRRAKLHHTLDWERFFRLAASPMWKQCAVRVAHPLQEDGISRIVVLPWRRSSGKASYEAFTRVLVESLGSDKIVVDHVKDTNIKDGVPLPSFGDAGGDAVAIFEPFEVADGFLEDVVGHLRSMHGCDMKAVVTFFKTNRNERPIVKETGMRDIQIVRLALAKEE